MSRTWRDANQIAEHFLSFPRAQLCEGSRVDTGVRQLDFDLSTTSSCVTLGKPFLRLFLHSRGDMMMPVPVGRSVKL